VNQKDIRTEICLCPDYSKLTSLKSGISGLGDLETLKKEYPKVPCEYCEPNRTEKEIEELD
jgi:hypothetical protein